MSKRKILTLAMALSMIAILAVGATLAYFTDTDSKTNVFTVGKVDITLIDEFEQNSKLLPATGSAQNGTIENEIAKKVGVTVNEGSEESWVRVHIAIPTILDDGDPTFNAAANTLHFNYTDDSVADGQWNWKTADGSKWNSYQAMIDGIKYNVYIVTYTSKVAAGKSTETYAMHQVYLDSKTTNEQIASISGTLGANWKMPVFAQGVQAAGFDSAYEAFETANMPSPWTVVVAE